MHNACNIVNVVLDLIFETLLEAEASSRLGMIHDQVPFEKEGKDYLEGNI